MKFIPEANIIKLSTVYDCPEIVFKNEHRSSDHYNLVSHYQKIITVLKYNAKNK